MSLNDKQVETIKQQREAFNQALERNNNFRSSRVAHALSISSDFHAAILTISLGLGAAIVPLVLLGKELSSDSKIFLTLASILLILNSIYLVLVLKNRAEELSIGATVSGLNERVLMLKMRNLLTKAIVTRDEIYFETYNSESRKIAEGSVDELEGSKWSNLNYSTDICVSLLIIAALFVLKPILPLSNFIYFSILLVFLALLIWWFIRLNKKYTHLNDSAKNVNAQGINEERDFNNFVNSLSQKKEQKDGDTTSDPAA